MLTNPYFNFALILFNIVFFIYSAKSEQSFSAKAAEDSDFILQQVQEQLGKQYKLLQIASRNIHSCDDADIQIKLATLDRLIHKFDQDEIDDELDDELGAIASGLDDEYEEGDYAENPEAPIEELIASPLKSAETKPFDDSHLADQFDIMEECQTKAGLLNQTSLQNYVQDIVRAYNSEHSREYSVSLFDMKGYFAGSVEEYGLADDTAESDFIIDAVSDAFEENTEEYID